MVRLGLLLACLACPAAADTVLAARTLRAQTILTAQDLVVRDVDVPGAFGRIEELLGQETRVAVYAGRPLRPGDVGPPALVDKNEVVTLIYDRNGLRIVTEGRALARGGVGELVQVMNLSSRNTLYGVVREDGSVEVN